MKVTMTSVPMGTIEGFAEKYDLEMEVCERRVPLGNENRFYASFKGSEEKGNGVLIGTYGNGATHEEAIANYAKAISMKTLVFDAYTDDRTCTTISSSAQPTLRCCSRTSWTTPRSEPLTVSCRMSAIR